MAQSKPITINWASQDLYGNKVSVPIANKLSIVAFVKPDQKQSIEALDAIQKNIKSDAAQILIVISGQSASDNAATLSKSNKYAYPIILDPDFDASGRFQVHVWPTTVVVQPDGTLAGHLAGLPISFADDLQSYLDFANHKIDGDGLTKRLTTHEVVQDDAAQAAKRRLILALRFLDNGNTDQAREQLEAGLKLQPQNPDLLLGMARLQIINNQSKDALELLDKIPSNSVPAWQLALLRGKAFVQQERWDDANKILPDAIKLNPSPAEAHYLLGLVHQHASDWQAAATEFRQAYETKGRPSTTTIGRGPG